MLTEACRRSLDGSGASLDPCLHLPGILSNICFVTHCVHPTNSHLRGDVARHKHEVLGPQLGQGPHTLVVSLPQPPDLGLPPQPRVAADPGYEPPLDWRHVAPHPHQELPRAAAVLHPQARVQQLDGGGLGGAAP